MEEGKDLHTGDFRTISSLDKKSPTEGSHVVLTKAEIPQDENVIYLNPGHAGEIPLGLIQNVDLYYEKMEDRKGKPFYHVHTAINVDNLIKNDLFKSSNKAKDILFDYINQQLGQSSHDQRFSVLTYLFEMKQTQPENKIVQQKLDENLQSINTLLARDYKQAKAITRVTAVVENYQTDKPWLNKVRAKADAILSSGSLEDQLKKSEADINSLKQKVA